jgi:hypothetical protein
VRIQSKTILQGSHPPFTCDKTLGGTLNAVALDSNRSAVMKSIYSQVYVRCKRQVCIWLTLSFSSVDSGSGLVCS